LVCCGARESLGTIATLQKKSIASGRARKTIAQHVYFTGKNQRWYLRKLGSNGHHFVRIWPRWLLLRLKSAPVVKALQHTGGGSNDMLGKFHHKTPVL
jgi:hypothetical protein